MNQRAERVFAAFDRGRIGLVALLGNLAITNQNLERYPAMLEVTTRLIAETRDWSSLLLHAIALQHTGDYAGALAAIDRGIADKPEHANSHYERACILAGVTEALLDLSAIAEVPRVTRDGRELLDVDACTAVQRDTILRRSSRSIARPRSNRSRSPISIAR